MTVLERNTASASASTDTRLPENATAAKSITVAIDEIIIDLTVHPRTEVHPGDVQRLRRVLRQNQSLAPPTVFVDGRVYILSDGFTRVEAHRAEGSKEIEVQSFQGSRLDAAIYAIKTNAKHGRKLTNAEKRSAVERLFLEADWGSRSDREIADACGCSHPTVARIRGRLIVSGKISTDVARTVRTKHGTRAFRKKAERPRRRIDRKAAVGATTGRARNMPQPKPFHAKDRSDDKSPYDSATVAIERLEAAYEDVDNPADVISDLVISDNYALFKRFEDLLNWMKQLVAGYKRAREHFCGSDEDVNDVLDRSSRKKLARQNFSHFADS